MPMLSWAGLKIFPYVLCTLLTTLNAFVHMVMYTYYFMAANPHFKQYLWWKKYITAIQLTQFAILLFQVIVLYRLDCQGLPKWLLHAGAIQDLYMIYAFSMFYKRAYSKETANAQQLQEQLKISDKLKLN